jgi:ABC-type Co2+ transport system permease subunit
MIVLDGISWRHIRWLIYLAGLLFYLFRVVRANQKDRVLLCEALGVGIFLAALLLYGLVGLPDWFMVVCGLVAVLFGILAAYFALLNWKERRVKKAKAK